MTGGPIAPLWLVLPLAGVALIVQAGYLIALKEVPRGKIPPSRKRIRTASSWLSMFAIPLSAYGFGFASTQDPRLFAIVWMVVIALIAGILLLAGLDAVNTLRLHRKATQGLRSEWKTSLKLRGTEQDQPSESGQDD